MQCVAEVLGRLVGVITRRRGRVITDGDVIEGTNFFLVKAILPVQASFGFVAEVRQRTSGQTNPILYFSHWEVLPIDPSFVPTTEQEIEELGIDGGYNLAKNLITDVRKAKGLAIDDVVVAAPEKQRTLARKK